MRRTILICAAAAALIAVYAAAEEKNGAAKISLAAGYGNAEGINQEELRIYDYFLAADPLEGRSFPSRGYDLAALYVASHLAEWGLRPGGSASGTNGPLQPYLMPIEMVARQVAAEESKVSLATPAGGRGPGRRGGGGAGSSETRAITFDYGRQWTAHPAGRFGGGQGGGPAALDVSGNLVFAGNGYVIHKTHANPYDRLGVRGKIIVVAGLPKELVRGESDGGRGANAPDPLGESCADYLTPEQYAAQNGALAVVRVATFQQAVAMSNPNAGGAGRGGRSAALNGPPFQVAKFQQPAACPSAPSITAGLDLTNALFQGEKATGAQVFYAAGANTEQDSFELASRKKLSLHLAVRSQPGHGENVIGILDGSDPALKDEYVVMSAHLDHLGLGAPLEDGHDVFSGADDDGSGVAGLLSIAHSYAAGAAKGIRPKRSMIFLWVGGEEKGLWGSQYFTEFPPVDLGKVVADLNMDMIGRTRNANSVDTNRTHVLANPGEVLLIGPQISSDDLGHTIDAVNAGFQRLKINHFYDVTGPDATHDNLGPEPRGQRIFYRSDHYNFARMGIPIAFFTTGLHADYHRLTDTPEKIDYQELQAIAKTVAAVGWALANQSGRPKLNANLPDELTRDMKTAEQQGWGKVTPVLAPLPGMPY